jgi:Secretion system C-terminal sorting domain
MKLLNLILIFCPLFIYGQDAAKDFCIPIDAVASESPASITLNWTENTATGTTYNIFRKDVGSSGWGSTIGSIATGNTTFVDNNVEVGDTYEYLVQKVSGSTLYSWGYINAGIQRDLTANRGDILVLVDETFETGLSSELDQLMDDLYLDSWMPKLIAINPTDSPQDVKAIIQAEYTALNDLNTVFLLGHIPVPYSGNLYPDAHTDHEGAWPADTYYGDLDGNWTDVSVDNTVANDVRNDNIPGDGKFDQSQTPSSLELEVCRVDFHDLPVYTATEEDLLRDYLNRAHEFKVGAYVPLEQAVYDQGSFTGMTEGFAQNGIRNFAPFVFNSNIVEADYATSLTTESYLWSYGCGPGSYTSAGSLDNGTSLTSAELGSSISLQASFTMLFGSYFGDWDKTNNFMRAALASGNTLSVSWAGRPNWHYHTMAQGDHLGSAAKMSMDVNTDYLSLSLGVGFVTGEGVHMAQLGDPSLRAYYVEPPSVLTVSNVNNVAELGWTASTDVSVDGYNIYRRTASSLWTQVNTSLVTSTTFSDATIPSGGDFEYMVKAVKLKTNGSGTFNNESLGTTNSALFSVGIVDLEDINLSFFPNPTKDIFTIKSKVAIQEVLIYSMTGQLISKRTNASNQIQINLSDFDKGTYLVVAKTDQGLSSKRISKI